jgi:hypothetical protein
MIQICEVWGLISDVGEGVLATVLGWHGGGGRAEGLLQGAGAGEDAPGDVFDGVLPQPHGASQPRASPEDGHVLERLWRGQHQGGLVPHPGWIWRCGIPVCGEELR